MSKNVVLTNANDEQILPVTTAENVFYDDDKTVKEKIDSLNSNFGNSIKVTTRVVTSAFTTLGSTTDDWIPVCVFNGDWGAYPSLAFDLIVENGTFKAVSRHFPAAQDDTVGGNIEDTQWSKRLNILWVNKKYFSVSV